MGIGYVLVALGIIGFSYLAWRSRVRLFGGIAFFLGVLLLANCLDSSDHDRDNINHWLKNNNIAVQSVSSNDDGTWTIRFIPTGKSCDGKATTITVVNRYNTHRDYIATDITSGSACVWSQAFDANDTTILIPDISQG